MANAQWTIHTPVITTIVGDKEFLEANRDELIKKIANVVRSHVFAQGVQIELDIESEFTNLIEVVEKDVVDSSVEEETEF